ncbi:unnamed protein product, partial [Brassica oleracea var. botrytis]
LVEVLRLSGGVGVTPTISEVHLASVHRLCSIAALLSLLVWPWFMVLLFC